jgi:hypothetical protein
VTLNAPSVIDFVPVAPDPATATSENENVPAAAVGVNDVIVMVPLPIPTAACQPVAGLPTSIWVPISRSTNGCESGTYGTVLISFTSRIRRFRCHWWNRYKGSWSELTYLGGVRPRVARLNILHNPRPSTTPRCTPKPTMRRVHRSITMSSQ